MNKRSMGIHHITAIVGHPQENLDFYSGVLGLRLIKKTVNFDDPETYHLYFGDESGNPGTILTFFPWTNARKGKIGDGQVGTTTFAVPLGTLEFWQDRLKSVGVKVEKTIRFDEEFIAFKDPHGLQLELVARAGGEPNGHGSDELTREKAIKGFAGTVLNSGNPESTATLLEEFMGLEKIAEDDEYIRFKSTSEIGNVIDLKKELSGSGETGVGMVHHIAWRAKDDQDQLEWKKLLEEQGFHVTEVKDRNYFKAIYFREEGGILFEIATDGPGFAHDEPYETMGEALMLPKQYEKIRSELEAKLIPLKSIR